MEKSGRRGRIGELESVGEKCLCEKLDSYSRQLILITRLEKGGKIIFVERSQYQCMRSEFWHK